MQNDGTLRQLIASRLRTFQPRPLERPGSLRAAVALAITEAGHGTEWSEFVPQSDWGTESALLLTRRAAHLRRHAGQWALPGGRLDDGETPEAAALRELHEEIGLSLSPDDVLGRLDDYPTRSGFVITPIVVWAGPARVLRPQVEEVASIHRMPALELLRQDAPLLEPGPEDDAPVLSMPFGQRWIGSPTAAVLYQYRELCLLGRPTRVAHFDQPAFAWH